jgi:hypothetical protein
MAKIDEIAGEKQRRSMVVETALREFIAREEKKRPKVAATEEAVKPGRPGAPVRPAAKPMAKPEAKPATAKTAAAKPVAAKAVTRAKR